MEHKQYIAHRPYDPFDDSVLERQRRMGLIDPDGNMDKPILAALARVYAGLFFDNLCDKYSSTYAVTASCQMVLDKAEAREALLELSLQHDWMRRTLPEPIWWMAGSDTLLTEFVSCFAVNLTELFARMEVME